MTLSFRGERYTLIYYTNKKHLQAPKSDIVYAESMEFPIPSKSFTHSNLALSYEPYAKRMETGLRDLVKWKRHVESDVIRERRNVYYDVLDGEINIMLKCGHNKCELKSFGRGPPKNAEEAYFRGRYVKVPGDVIHRHNTTYCLGRVLGFMPTSTALYEVRFKLNTWILKREDFEPYLVDRSREVLDETWLDDHDGFCAKCYKTNISESNKFVCILYSSARQDVIS